MLPYTEEQKIMKEAVRKLAKKKIEPLVQMIDSKGDGLDEAVKILARNDLLKLQLPAEYGGINADYTTIAIVIEEMAKIDAGIAMYIFSSAAGFGVILNNFINEEQKSKLFSFCRTGDKLGAFLLTEPGHGSDAANIATRAILKGDYYIVNGSKTMATNGPVAEYCVLFARTGPGERSRGISCFLFQRNEVSGVSSSKPFDKLGFRASKTSEIYFEDAKICKECLIGKEGEGWEILVSGGGGMRVWGASSIALGNAEGALEYAIKYAKERVTFGKPLSQHQAIQFMIAEMGIEIEAARSLHFRSLQMLDQGGYSQREFQLITSATKCFCCDMAMKITTNAVQILGAYGVMNEYPMGRRMRDAKVNQIFDGASEMQKMIVGKALTS